MTPHEQNGTDTHLNIAHQLSANVIDEDLAGTGVYETLNAEQREWLLKIAGPLFVEEGCETTLAIERERLGDPRRVDEKRLADEVEDFLRIGRAPDDLVEGE